MPFDLEPGNIVYPEFRFFGAGAWGHEMLGRLEGLQNLPNVQLTKAEEGGPAPLDQSDMSVLFAMRAATLSVYPHEHHAAVLRASRGEDIAEGLRMLIGLLRVPAYINMDWGDVGPFLRGAKSVHLRIAVGSTAKEAAARLVQNPPPGERFIVCISGTEDMDMDELEEAISLIDEKLPPRSNLLMGFAVGVAIDQAEGAKVAVFGVIDS